MWRQKEVAMSSTAEGFRRARSAAAKSQREGDILAAARRLAAEGGVRSVTLTDIAAEIGMHKSALLRYYETREQIFLVLAGQAWREWSAALRLRSQAVAQHDAAAVAGLLAETLVARPVFCDLLAHVPLHLERNVSVEQLRVFKLVALDEVGAICAVLGPLLGLEREQAIGIVSTATSMAGALWQMATPDEPVRRLYRAEPRLSHAIIDVEARLRETLLALIVGYVTLSGRDG